MDILRSIHEGRAIWRLRMTFHRGAVLGCVCQKGDKPMLVAVSDLGSAIGHAWTWESEK
jgi:hypothetical protein